MRQPPIDISALTEEEVEEAINLERTLTAYQVFLLVGLATGSMQHSDLREPTGEQSQMLELERLSLIIATDLPGTSYELALTKKGTAVASWMIGIMTDLIEDN